MYVPWSALGDEIPEHAVDRLERSDLFPLSRDLVVLEEDLVRCDCCVQHRVIATMRRLDDRDITDLASREGHVVTDHIWKFGMSPRCRALSCASIERGA